VIMNTPEYPNIEQIEETEFDDESGRYFSINNENMIPCAMMDKPIIFTMENE
jgi:hypothetical protein